MAGEVEIRAARAGEAEAVVAMYEWLFAPPGARPPRWDPVRAAGRVARAIDAPDATVLVAGDRELVGLCTAYLDVESVRFGQRCWVEDLAVAPERRSRGIGRALLGAARDWARERGATHLELDTGENRPDSQRFYEREGPSWRTVGYAWVL